MRRLTIACVLVPLVILPPMLAAQITSPAGNIDVYSRKTGSTQFGLLTSTITMPAYNGDPLLIMRQKGLLFSETYNVGSFDPLVFGMNDQLVFALEGALRVGFGFGSANLGTPWGPFTQDVVKYYIGEFDPFSLDLTASYTHMFWNGKGVNAKIGVTLANIGATAAVMEKGTFQNNDILVANVLPVQISGSLSFDFGRSELGASFLVNTSNILSFTSAPTQLFDQESRGVVSKTIIKKSAFQVFYGF